MLVYARLQGLTTHFTYRRMFNLFWLSLIHRTSNPEKANHHFQVSLAIYPPLSASQYWTRHQNTDKTQAYGTSRSTFPIRTKYQGP